MESEELTKLVDGIYKNILEKFNPGARQMIYAGKAYLKALHGAAAASRLYVETITKLARHAQQGTWGASSDIGTALMKVVEVFKEIQDHQMNVLKAFYVDLLVPLETNLEKDTKVVQSEQKKFLQQHKQRIETYSKVAAAMKKQRKKSRGNKTETAMDKELKNMQVLEEEKTKLDAFCEQSLKNAMTQERRRYGFVLERQCSLAKHKMSYYSDSVAAYEANVERWFRIAQTRECLPDSVVGVFSTRLRNMSPWQNEDVYSSPRSPNLEEDRMSSTSKLRKTNSVDTASLELGSVGSPVGTISRARSEFNLNSINRFDDRLHTRPKSMAIPPPPPKWDTKLAKALYAYLSSGENQLSFLEDDIIALIGKRNKGWQFGENLRTQCTGWFPLAYTEILDDEDSDLPIRINDINELPIANIRNKHTRNNSKSTDNLEPPGNNNIEFYNHHMFGSMHFPRNTASVKQTPHAVDSNRIPPPTIPAPDPASYPPYRNMKNHPSSFNTKPYSTNSQKTDDMSRKSHTLQHHSKDNIRDNGARKAANQPPPQPEVDYFDDESFNEQVNTSTLKRGKSKTDKNNNTLKGNAANSTKSKKNDDQMLSTTEDKFPIKRTKSFWKFTKNSDILEGMALWKHRDLVDIKDTKPSNESKETSQSMTMEDDDSSDSNTVIQSSSRNSEGKATLREHENKSIIDRKKTTISAREQSKKHMDNQFYDDGDGLLLKTVNRRNILKQYDNDDSTEIESVYNDYNGKDNPYDSILVEDQKIEESSEQYYPNVANIGKQMEKFAQSQKGNKNEEMNRSKTRETKKNEINSKSKNENMPNNMIPGGMNQYPTEKRYSFRTFKDKPSDGEKQNNKHKQNSNQRYNRNLNESYENERFYDTDRQKKSEINSDKQKKKWSTRDNESEHYDSNNEDTFNTRTYNSSSIKYNKNDLINYGETLKRRMENMEYEGKYMDRAPHNGETYGPWYDLWGLDGTAKK